LAEYISQFVDYLSEGTVMSKIVGSVLIVPLALVLRWILNRSLSKVEIRSPELRLRWSVQIRNMIFALTTVALLLIWASELRTTAISLVAFGVAIVISIKELITCITGSFLKISTRAFSVGDRIEVNGMRGDVIDQTLLTTNLMEIGPGENLHQYTGRILTIPNCLFLNNPIINHSVTHDYAIVTFNVPVKADANWQEHEAWLIDAANEICEPYMDDARRHWQKEHDILADLPKVEPRVSVQMKSPDELNMVVRIPVPNHQRNNNCQQILRRYLQRKQSEQAKHKSDQADTKETTQNNA
jgi:small-conductance mechanosensitive channel